MAPRPVPPTPPVTGAYSVTEQQILINGDRARNGLALLAWNGCLAGVAEHVAARIAAAGALSEYGSDLSADLACRLGSNAGENEAQDSFGVADVWANTALMNSPDHRANILGPYRYVATAWAVALGLGFLVEEFG